MSDVAIFSDPQQRLEALPVALVSRSGAHVLDRDGCFETLDLEEAARKLSSEPHLICARAWAGRLLNIPTDHCFDVLELAAFVLPARTFTPTLPGLARLLGQTCPADHDDQLLYLRQAAGALLQAPLAPLYPHRTAFNALAMSMAKAEWPWGTYLLGVATGMHPDERNYFDGLPQWEGEAPPPPPEETALHDEDVLAQLARFLPQKAEDRPGQKAYAKASIHSFNPRDHVDAPNVLLSEAGTGIGKTLGYAAAATRWAEEAGGPVWIATYTRALQRQIDQELTPFFLDKRRKLVVRKGRENYLCLLNLEDAMAYAKGGAARTSDAILIGLIARWALASRDGDLIGGDFPSWLAAQFGANRSASLTDHRGECIYSACRHYRRCFIEHSQRKTQRAQIVIANHAVVMIQAARAADAKSMPTRLIFDEAHHVFDAADSAFSAYVSGQEMSDLRRWVLGNQGGRRSRGLEARLSDLLYDLPDAAEAMRALIDAAGILPNEGWLNRLRDGASFGPAEAFLGACRAQILARAKPSRYDLEANIAPATPELMAAAQDLLAQLVALRQPFIALLGALAASLEDETGSLGRESRGRIEGLLRQLDYRARSVDAWCQMLGTIDQPPPPEEESSVVDWLSLTRYYGRDVDVGMRRHAVDPTQAFANLVLKPAHGVLMTSATLRDKLPDDAEVPLEGSADWAAADARTGAQHLIHPPRRFSAKSPFDYATQTKVIVVNNLDKNDNRAVANAYRHLFLASGGGALGLFTAIARLTQVHSQIFDPLHEAGIDLYAQHVDPIDVGALVDIFREAEHSCLLGTDALRDGIDVPGHALRMIVMDRVPWPRPSILHRARRAAFGGRSYDEMLARFKLIQAYGRLIRRTSDRGAFVMLDAATPTRLFSGFPDNVEICRMGLDEAVYTIKEMFAAPF